jgi:hypothetical protein
MSRITTAYVSRYQLDRVKALDLYANAKVTLTCNFKGANAGNVQSATWYTNAPWSTVLSSPSRVDEKTSVTVTAALPDLSTLRCEAVMVNGEVLNQYWQVRVKDAPYFNQAASQGPEFVVTP